MPRVSAAPRCRKWFRLTYDEASSYPDEHGRVSTYHICGICKTGVSHLYLVHCKEGEGEAECIRCGKDVNVIWLCRNRRYHY
jgi:hypothetical protein